MDKLRREKDEAERLLEFHKDEYEQLQVKHREMSKTITDNELMLDSNDDVIKALTLQRLHRWRQTGRAGTAADAPIVQLNRSDAVVVRARALQDGGIHVYRSEVVHEHRNPEAATVFKHAPYGRRLSGTEEAADERDGRWSGRCCERGEHAQ